MKEPSTVEKMARGAYEKFIEAVRDLEPSWDGLPQSHRDRMIDSQRAAIEAMRDIPIEIQMAGCAAQSICSIGLDGH